MKVNNFIRNRIRQRCLLVLVSIAICLSTSTLLRYVALAQKSAGAKLVNLSGQQRILSQRIALSQNLLLTEPFANPNKQVREELTSLTNKFEQIHWAIIEAVPLNGQVHGLSDQQLQLYFYDKPNVHQLTLDLIDRSNAITGMQNQQNMLINSIKQESPASLLNKLDEAVYQFEKESIEDSAHLITLEWQLWLGNIIVLFMLVLFSFKPIDKLVVRNSRKYHLEKRTKQAAKYASKAKGQFLVNISHELRTPLSGMFGMMELAQQEPDRQKQEKLLRKAEVSGQQLLTLIDNMLDISKIETDELELDNVDFNLTKLLDNCLAPAAANCDEKGVSFSFEALSPLPNMLNGDPLLLSRVINNLLSNALKFTSYGSITATASISVKDKSFLFSFTVHDTGVGIDDSDLHRIFEKFTQLDNSQFSMFKGTGLGLTIAEQIVEKMGGGLHVSSVVGKGSTFSFEVPMAKSETTLVATNLPNSAGTIKFAVVDDLQTSRDYIACLLQSEGYEAEVFAAGADFLRGITSIKEYSAIIIDIHMPGLNGYELADILKAQHGDKCPPLVFISASSESVSRSKLDSISNWQAFSKPINKDRFVDSLAILVNNNYQSTFSNRSLDILVVEDEPINAEVVSTMLRQMGHVVILASTGREAVDIATRESIDLILMDINLPDFSGIQATTEILQHHKIKVPIVALTANAFEDNREAYKLSGMKYHLTKPVHCHELEEVVNLVT